MVHGRVARPPQYGAQLEASTKPGRRRCPASIAVVRDGSFLGVVAEREEQAIKAREALSPEREMEGGTAICPIRRALRAS